MLFVPLVPMLLFAEPTRSIIWLAAAVASIGIVCVQVNDTSVDRSRVLASVVFALLGALTMTLFDLWVQRWAPAWGAGYFLPLAFAFAGLFAIAFLPLANRPRDLASRQVLVPLLVGSVIMAVQAIGMTFTLAKFGDATRVNIVYALRGLWGVSLTWLLLGRFGSRSERPSNRIMTMRLAGALLIGLSVWLSVT